MAKKKDRSSAKIKPAKKPVKKAAAVAAPKVPKAIRLANVGGVSKGDWGPLRRQLLEKRRSTLEAMRKIASFDHSGDVGDEADQAGRSLEKELQFELSDNERNLLDQIEGALRKMEKGTYGLCEQCRKPINKARVKALPFARYCILCQSNAERASFS